MRYYYKIGKNEAEVAIYKGNLRGLILVDFEFKTVKEKNNFQRN
jgi:CYTH domain-containing protein